MKCDGCQLRGHDRSYRIPEMCNLLLEPHTTDRLLLDAVDRRYPYHVFVQLGESITGVFRSRNAGIARHIASCLKGQFWRFTTIETMYPDVHVCDFSCEEYVQSDSNERRSKAS